MHSKGDTQLRRGGGGVDCPAHLHAAGCKALLAWADLRRASLSMFLSSCVRAERIFGFFSHPLSSACELPSLREYDHRLSPMESPLHPVAHFSRWPIFSSLLYRTGTGYTGTPTSALYRDICRFISRFERSVFLHRHLRRGERSGCRRRGLRAADRSRPAGPNGCTMPLMVPFSPCLLARWRW